MSRYFTTFSGVTEHGELRDDVGEPEHKDFHCFDFHCFAIPNTSRKKLKVCGDV